MSREEGSSTQKRKERSDKKREIKPTISVDLKDCIYSLSYIINQPVKTLGEIICEKGLGSRRVIEYLSNNFRRDFKFSQTIFIGDMDRQSLQKKIQKGKNERITLRFNNQIYERINSLANAMDVTPSKATALLLDASIRNTNLLNAIVKLYLHEQLDEGRMKELKGILRYINKNNPYDEEISWFVFIGWILEELKEGSHNLKNAVANWMDKYK